MRTICIAAAILLTSCTQSTPIPATAKAPEMGWKEFGRRTFALSPEQIARWDLAKIGRVKVTVSANAPVDFKIDVGGCEAARVLSASAECKVKAIPQPTLMIRDARSDAGLAAIGAAWTHSSKLAEHAIASNRVEAVLYRWDCIANCPLASR